MIDFRRIIKSIMDRRGISQKSLCEDLFIPRANFCRYLSGKRDMASCQVARILEYLGVSLYSPDIFILH